MWQKNVEWHLDADVVVVGYGGAGAVAAVTSHDAGAHVIVLERQERTRRSPNTFMSGGSFISPSDPEGALEHMKQLYRSGDGLYETHPEVLKAWAYRSAENLHWVETMGGRASLFAKVGEHHTVPGHDAIQAYRFADGEFPTPWEMHGHGYGMFLWLQQLVEERSIDVEYGVRAHWLLTDSNGDVVGVQASRQGEVVNVRAARAVILTTGGFEFNEQLKQHHLPVRPTRFYGSPDNTGDGVLMAQEIGAALWHMCACSAKAIAWFPDFPTGFPVNFWGYGYGFTRAHSLAAGDAEAEGGTVVAACGVMQVDRHGRRFTNELWKAHTHYYELTGYDSQLGMYPRVPSYWIFDDARMKRGQLPLRENGAAGPLQMYDWSQDNQRELERGWIIRGGTIEQLATKIDVDAAALRDTLRSYNDSCETGIDPLGPPPKGRPPHTLVSLEPPFYAVPLWPGGPNTQGGPERNARAQVMRVTGDPVRRLYAAGELGSIYGTRYPLGGGNIAECIAFGRIAGENASQEPRR